MKRSVPYQPLLLRIIHGASVILVIGAIISGFLVYNTFDGRFGKISIPKFNYIQDIHGTFGLFFLLLLPAFALYSFHAGERRLLQRDLLSQITQFGQPIWWVSWQRFANTLMLIAAVFAVISGRMMKEEWLPTGQLDHTWYLLHLTAWVVIFFSVMLHLLMSAKVGGIPLLLSMFLWKVRPEDSPNRWYSRYRTWWSSVRANFGVVNKNWLQNNPLLRIIEVIVFAGIFIAFILPVLFPGTNS